MIEVQSLTSYIVDAREKTFALVADLSDEEMLGPQLRIVNPPLWEIGHVAWFQEFWVLRHAAGLPPLRPEVDAFYDSMAVAHDTRWDLPLYSRESTYRYLNDVRDRVLDRLQSVQPTVQDIYLILLATFHEDMHNEAFTYTLQTHAYSAPRFIRDAASGRPYTGGPLPGDVKISGGTLMLGSTAEDGFIFDNEKWAHPVEVAPFKIARAAVTQQEFAAFVEDGGYSLQKHWSEAGWAWREAVMADCPVYWRKGGRAWERRVFDQWVALEPNKPVIHVNWYEAEAYCRWARRRLPKEAEWEMAASWDPQLGKKLKYPWGDEPPTPENANLDWAGGGTLDVGALPEGDSPRGCRQMIGNTWEWTSTDFLPFPGFSADPYKDYSEPWFYDHKVLRGGCWATRSRLIRNAYRNFYKPDRRDVWAGFRTCAL